MPARKLSIRFLPTKLHPFFFPRSATRSGCPTLAFSEMASHHAAATLETSSTPQAFAIKMARLTVLGMAFPANLF